MRKSKNEGGYFSMEAALLMPMLLIATCILIALFYCFIKWGALDLIFNHQLLSNQLRIEPQYHFEQIVDSYTQIQEETKYKDLMGSASQMTLSGVATIDPPFLKRPTQWQSMATQVNFPLFYKIKASQLMEGQLNALRSQLNHE